MTDPDERTVLDVPDELLAACRAAAVATAPHIEAAIVPLVTRAYRDGWADGYLALHHETEETR